MEATSSMANGRDGQDRRDKTMNIRYGVMRVMARCLYGNTEAEGQTMVEYSLILVLMIIVCFSILGTLSDTVNTKLFQVVQAMP
jgi:Flp pilus assembly pilin Flp